MFDKQHEFPMQEEKGPLPGASQVDDDISAMSSETNSGRGHRFTLGLRKRPFTERKGPSRNKKGPSLNKSDSHKKVEENYSWKLSSPLSICISGYLHYFN